MTVVPPATFRLGNTEAYFTILALPPDKRGSQMPLMNLVVTLIVVGVLLWLVNNYIPMDGKIKQILNVVVVIGVVIWLLQALGLLGSLGNIRIGN